MTDWLLNDPDVQAALIAATFGFAGGVVVVMARHLLDRWALTHKLQTEQAYDERKKLRSTVSLHKGLILEAAERLSHRLWNLQENESKNGLSVNGRVTDPVGSYYYSTTVYRFLALFALVRRFDSAAIFVDSRLAKDKELTFLKYTKALEWVMTDAALFSGLQYEAAQDTDHLFRDNLRIACDVLITSESIASVGEFQAMLVNGVDYRLRSPLEFFDGLCASESRYRWDRIMALHLLLMAFLNAFGYDMQKSDDGQLRKTASRIGHPRVRENLARWLPKLGLSRDRSAKRLQREIWRAQGSNLT